MGEPYFIPSEKGGSSFRVSSAVRGNSARKTYGFKNVEELWVKK